MKKWNIGWGTISNCNMNCKFCYSRFRRENSNDLKYTDWIKFIDENHDYINSINYGTGENSLSDDWFKLVDYIRQNYPQIRQAVTTNGYISEQLRKDITKKQIVLNSIDEMDISLDFYEEEKHNEFRGQKKAYRWAIDTLKFCSENNIRPTIVCLGSALNANPENLEGIFKIADKYSSLVRVNLYRPTEGINNFTKKFILSPEKLLELLHYINKEHKILSISDALYSSLLTETFEEDPSGIDSLRILADGDITPSTYLISQNYIVGNIKESDVLKKISQSKLFENIIKEVIPAECSECKYKGTCKGGVYDRRLLWHNTLDKKDPYCAYEPGQEDFEKVSISKERFESVHHGYLPTMFFLP